MTQFWPMSCEGHNGLGVADLRDSFALKRKFTRREKKKKRGKVFLHTLHLPALCQAEAIISRLSRAKVTNTSACRKCPTTKLGRLSPDLCWAAEPIASRAARLWIQRLTKFLLLFKLFGHWFLCHLWSKSTLRPFY